MGEKVLIVGLGEVGHTLFELFTENGKFDVYGYDSDKAKMVELAAGRKLPGSADVMHICYPCIDQAVFMKTTLDYIRMIKPKLTIIESTVPPGTTQEIYDSSKLPIAHSPIRGMHESKVTMKKDVLFWKKYVGAVTEEAAEAAKQHFEKLGLTVKVLKSPMETELAKLFETTYRAMMIACFQEMHRISMHFGADFDNVVDMIEDIHRVDLNKPLHYPAVIGGHCLIPNTMLLLKSYDSQFFRLILKSNEERKEEIKDQAVQEEVEKIRKRVRRLEIDLSRRKG